MPMRVKLDEALSQTVAEPLHAGGYSVTSVRQQGWGGWKDSQLWPRLQAEKVLFITTDKAFGDIRAYPPGTHAGIILLRPDRESIPAFKALVTRVLERHRLESLAGTVTVATSRAIRIRRKS